MGESKPRVTADPETEVPLGGGNTTDGLVRVGSTVRRPPGPWTPAVHALLSHLNDVGYDGALRTLGIDERGRHVVEYVEGEVEAFFPHGQRGGASALVRVGRRIRDFHDAVVGFSAPPDAMWNVTIAPDEDTAWTRMVAGGSRPSSCGVRSACTGSWGTATGTGCSHGHGCGRKVTATCGERTQTSASATSSC